MKAAWKWFWTVIGFGVVGNVLAYVLLEQKLPWFLQWPSLISGTYAGLTADVTTSRIWWWFSLGAVVFVIVAFLLGALSNIKRGFVKAVQPWKSYREDSFFGAIWRWDYAGNRIDDVIAYCLRCDRQFFVEESMEMDFKVNSQFQCSCGNQIKLEGKLTFIEAKVKVEIETQVRNNRYPGAPQIHAA